MLSMLLALQLVTQTAAAGDSNVSRCEMNQSAVCQNCEDRIPVSCDEHATLGSVSAKSKPNQIEWVVISSNGTEHTQVLANTKWTLRDLKNARDLAPLFGKYRWH